MKTIKVLSSVLALFFLFTLISNQSLAQTSTKESKYKTMDLSVDMACNACKNNVEKCLAYEKGVKKFDVNLDSKKVHIVYNSDKTDRAT